MSIYSTLTYIKKRCKVKCNAVDKYAKKYWSNNIPSKQLETDPRQKKHKAFLRSLSQNNWRNLQKSVDLFEPEANYLLIRALSGEAALTTF